MCRNMSFWCNKEKMKSDILIVGVGGQGIILTSDIISKAALKDGFNVKKAETHGMAQRGGSVITHVRISNSDIYSPLIPKGKVDVLIGFEPMEALRYMGYINRKNKNSIMIVNRNPIEIENYPDINEIISEIKRHRNSIILNALELANKAGNVLTQNIVMLGAASRYLPIDRDTLKETIKGNVKRAINENLKAFELGSQI